MIRLFSTLRKVKERNNFEQTTPAFFKLIFIIPSRVVFIKLTATVLLSRTFTVHRYHLLFGLMPCTGILLSISVAPGMPNDGMRSLIEKLLSYRAVFLQITNVVKLIIREKCKYKFGCPRSDYRNID